MLDPDIQWDPLKSERLKRTRKKSFEELLNSKLIDVRDHPFRETQEMMLFEHEGQIWIVPFVRKEGKIFLKTLYPSRKFTRLYKKGELA